MQKRPWCVTLPRYWPAGKGRSRQSRLKRLQLWIRFQTWAAHGWTKSAVIAGLLLGFAKRISRRPTPVHLDFFFSAPQQVLPTSNPPFCFPPSPCLFFVCSGAGLPFTLLIPYLVFTYTNHFTCQLHHQTSQLPVSLRRDNFLH